MTPHFILYAGSVIVWWQAAKQGYRAAMCLGSMLIRMAVLWTAIGMASAYIAASLWGMA